MRKWTAAVLAAVMLLGILPARTEAAEAAQSVYQQIEAAGLTVNWLELDGQYLNFNDYYIRENYFNVQSANKGKYEKDRYGREFFYTSGGWGKVDTQGKVIVPFDYEMVGTFSEGMVFVAQSVENEDGVEIDRYGAYNEAGELVVPVEFDDIDEFCEGVAKASTGAVYHVEEDWFSTDGGKAGYIDKSGEWVIAPEFNTGGTFHDGVAIVGMYYEDDEGTIYSSVNALMDKEGNLLTPFENLWWISYAGDGYYEVNDYKQNAYGIIDKQGEVIIPFQYRSLSYLHEGLFTASKVNEADEYVTGVIDIKGNVVIPFEYDQIDYRDGDLLIKATNWVVKPDGYHGRLTTYFDLTGKKLHSDLDFEGGRFQYQITDFSANERWYPDVESYMDYRTGMINMAGKIILQPKYQSVKPLSDDRAAVYFGGGCAMFDGQGERMTAFQYDSMDEFVNGLSCMRRDGYYGVINEQGKEVVPPVFTKMSEILDSGFVMVSVGAEEDDVARIGILQLTEEMAKRTDDNPNFIRATLNGSDITFDRDPIVRDGRTLVPMRIIFEELGAMVDWDSSRQQVTGTRKTADGEETEIILFIGSDTAYVNGEALELDVPASLEGGRTYVPLRFIAESLDMDVIWDEKQLLIRITD